MTAAEVTVEAFFGDAAVRMAVDACRVRDVVAHWDARMKTIQTDDVRRDTRQMIVEGLMEERHKQPQEAEVLASAILWLAATNPQYGEKLLALMTKGGMGISYEITRLGPTNFNFRLETDEATLAALSPSSKN